MLQSSENSSASGYSDTQGEQRGYSKERNYRALDRRHKNFLKEEP